MDESYVPILRQDSAVCFLGSENHDLKQVVALATKAKEFVVLLAVTKPADGKDVVSREITHNVADRTLLFHYSLLSKEWNLDEPLLGLTAKITIFVLDVDEHLREFESYAVFELEINIFTSANPFVLKTKAYGVEHY